MVKVRNAIINISIVCILFLTQLMYVSCQPSQSMISSLSSIKYGDSSEVMDASGFYTLPVQSHDSITGKKLLFYNYIFYPDQTMCAFYLEDDSLEKYDVHTSLERCFYKWGRNKRKWGQAWGVYKKQGDHIYTELCDNIYLFTGTCWNFSKHDFIIKGDTLYGKEVILFNSSGRKEIEKKDFAVYLFVPTESLPQQSIFAHYLKKRKWRWRNTKDWEDYMGQYKRTIRTAQ